MHRLDFYLVLLLTLLPMTSVIGNEPKPTTAGEKSDLDFDGKIVLLSIDESTTLEKDSSTATLSEARLVDIGRRAFIVGKVYYPEEYHERYPHLGAQAGYPWESVRRFMLLTPEQYSKYVEAYQKNAEE